MHIIKNNINILMKNITKKKVLFIRKSFNIIKNYYYLNKLIYEFYRLKYRWAIIAPYYWLFFSLKRYNVIGKVFKKRRFIDLKPLILQHFGLKWSPRAFVSFFFLYNSRLWVQEDFLFVWSIQSLITNNLSLRFRYISLKRLQVKIQKFARVVQFLYSFLSRIKNRILKKKSFIGRRKVFLLSKAFLWNEHIRVWSLNILNNRKIFLSNLIFLNEKGRRIRKFSHRNIKFSNFSIIPNRIKKNLKTKRLKSLFFKFFFKRNIYKFIVKNINFKILYFNKFYYNLSNYNCIPLWKNFNFSKRMSLLYSLIESFFKNFILRFFSVLGANFLNRFTYIRLYARKRVRLTIKWWLFLCVCSLKESDSNLLFNFYSSYIKWSFFFSEYFNANVLCIKINPKFGLRYFLSSIFYGSYLLFPHFLKKWQKKFNFRFFKFKISSSFNSSFLKKEFCERLKINLNSIVFYNYYNFANFFYYYLFNKNYVVDDLSDFLTPMSYISRFFNPLVIDVLKEHLKVTTLTVKELLELPQRSHSFIKRRNVLDGIMSLDYLNIFSLSQRSDFRYRSYFFSFFFTSSSIVDFSHVFVSKCVGGFFHKALGQFFLCFDYGFKKILNLPLLAILSKERFRISSSSNFESSRIYAFFVELLKLKFYKIYNRPKRFKYLKFLDWNDFLITEEWDPSKKGPQVKEKFSIKLLNSLYEVVEYGYSFRKQIALYRKSFVSLFFSSLSTLNFLRFFNSRSLYKGVVLSSVTLMLYFKRYRTFPSLLNSTKRFANLKLEQKFYFLKYVTFVIVLDFIFILKQLLQTKEVIIYDSLFTWFVILFYYFAFYFKYLRLLLLVKVLLDI